MVALSFQVHHPKQFPLSRNALPNNGHMTQTLGFPDGSVVKNHLQCRTHRKTQVQSLGQEDPLEASMASQVLLPGESHGQRSLAGYSPLGLQRAGHN